MGTARVAPADQTFGSGDTMVGGAEREILLQELVGVAPRSVQGREDGGECDAGRGLGPADALVSLDVIGGTGYG